ncbi:MAG: hotdog domain-containing protein, partial [Candidatus Sedimenticola sp. (ex Thyasira tokunagai)]
ERARTEWLRQLGFEQDELLEKEGILFAVRRVAVDYLRPARFNDELLVSASISKQGRASLTFQQEIRMADGQTLCRGEVQVAALDAVRFRPVSLPVTILELINDGH